MPDNGKCPAPCKHSRVPPLLAKDLKGAERDALATGDIADERRRQAAYAAKKAQAVRI